MAMCTSIYFTIYSIQIDLFSTSCMRPIHYTSFRNNGLSGAAFLFQSAELLMCVCVCAFVCFHIWLLFLVFVDSPLVYLL